MRIKKFRRPLPKSGRTFMKEGLVHNAKDLDLSEDKTATESKVQNSDRSYDLGLG